MTIENLRVTLWAPVLVALGLPQLATAQDDERFEEITVTATKREESIYDVPISMSAFTGDNLWKPGDPANLFGSATMPAAVFSC